MWTFNGGGSDVLRRRRYRRTRMRRPITQTTLFGAIKVAHWIGLERESNPRLRSHSPAFCR